jgi:curved DNA-binding protein CbpA
MPFRPRILVAAARTVRLPRSQPFEVSALSSSSSSSLSFLSSSIAPRPQSSSNPQWLVRRSFHASARLRSSSSGGDEEARKNHYERLNVRYDATPADIKRSFYTLSKSHHPDVNPSNPDAAENFSRLSESYHVLSNPTRRAAYDRDVLRLHQHQHQHQHAHHGSYHSTNPAGGRAPSGLSRRRGTFRGPPPSFYRSGGYGAHADKRRQAHEESTGSGGEGAGSFGQHQQGQSQSTGGGGPWSSPFGGMGPGSDPYGHHGEVPHFDKETHTRTHRRQDERRAARRRAVGDDDIEFEPQTSLAGHFFIVSGILIVTILSPLLYLQFARDNRKKKSGV